MKDMRHLGQSPPKAKLLLIYYIQNFTQSKVHRLRYDVVNMYVRIENQRNIKLQDTKK